jgi:3-isopropylmalate/(R)-2-methylmalate dehydratase large subunit
LVYRLAKNMHIKINGTLPVSTTSKDMILNIISQIGAKGAIGYVVEFSGSALIDLSTEARFTLCNMAVEAGARGALIAPDKTAIDYVLARCPDITGEIKDRALVHWASLYSDADAQFEKAYEFDASDMAPFVTWGTSPDQAIAINAAIPTKDSIQDPIDKLSLEQALRYTKLSDGQRLEGTPIDHVFIGSCTNGRIEDLRNVIAAIGDRKVAPGVRAMVVPGSGAVKAQAEQEGIADKLIAAGFEWRKPGCSMCLAMNDDVLTSGTRCASTTNRNFEGRQGRGAITHLMSPAMAAAAAVTGKITDVRKLQGAANA